MIREAIEQGDKITGSRESDAAISCLEAAERHAVADIHDKVS